jgi:hypothetical protein
MLGAAATFFCCLAWKSLWQGLYLGMLSSLYWEGKLPGVIYFLDR